MGKESQSEIIERTLNRLDRIILRGAEGRNGHDNVTIGEIYRRSLRLDSGIAGHGVRDYGFRTNRGQRKKV